MFLLMEISWPAGRLGELIAALGRRSRFAVRAIEPEGLPARIAAEGGPQLESWIEATSGRLGLEAEPVEVPYADVDQLLRGAGPALLRLADEAGPRFLGLLGGDRHRITLLTPDLSMVRVRPEVLRAALCAEVEAPVAGGIERILTETGLRGARRMRARDVLLGELLASRRIGGCWLLRPSGAASLVTQVRETRLPRLLLALLGVHAFQYGLWLGSWWLLGWMALTGRFDLGWLVAWQLLLLTLIPFRLLTTSLAGRLAIQAGALLKRRLLVGVLKLEPDEVRHLGVGQLLGRVIESEVIETTALAGGFLGLTASVELVMAGFVLGAGAGGWFHSALLLGSVLAVLGLGLRYYRHRWRWTQQRLDLTNDLVEQMVGHRTRLAQEPSRSRNEGEDQMLERYLGASADLDRTGVALQALVPRCWLLVGMLGLAPVFVAGDHSTAGLAIGVGGVILAYQAFRGLVEGLDQVAAAAIAWGRIQHFWRAASRREPIGQPGWATCRSPAASWADRGRILLDARELVFRYPGRGESALREVNVQVHVGDRLLLEGPSGGGKSTLAWLLSGGRAPESGLLLLDGLDRATLGADGWRRRVVLAPQFHENHVLMGPFAFNALMGRAWPPRPSDIEEAERVCRALGLGPLLDRMPAGFLQMVGETGWQLSHGEKSRLFLARALLQGADLVILDESFAALDPETLRQSLAFVLDEAPTVLVIAHP